MGRNRSSAWLCSMICCVLAGASVANAQNVSAEKGGWGLVPLMRALAQVQFASAKFTERKTMAVLSAPLLSSGTLTYVAPDRIEKITVSPVPERFVLDHDRITMSGGPDHRTYQFSPAQYPQIGGLVEGIRATLAGDLPRLDRYYIVRLAGTQAQWHLKLQPKTGNLARFIRSILIEGSADRISAIDTTSGNGDVSRMKVAETVSDAR